MASLKLAGRMNEHVVESELLRDNVLGDPAERPLWVYTPPGYDDGDETYPVCYLLLGYAGTLPMWRNRTPFRKPVPELFDAMVASGEAPPMILVFVDAWTSYGGSQFVDSVGTGRYHSYLCEEVVAWVDRHYRTRADREYRAIAGKSSGGLGAAISAMLRPDLFGAFATHSGDSLSEAQYIPHFLHAARQLRPYGGDIFAWWADFGSRVAFTKDEDLRLLELLGVSACFSPDPDGKPLLPFDPVTGALVEDVWRRWLEWDPVRMARGYAEALRSQKGIWIDAGTRDEWFLDLGATAFRRVLGDIGVADDVVEFELFDAGHVGIEYRHPLALSWLARRLTDQEG
ncbi:alpha/beta hydrolase [Stackebrandtia nassauensis]|uniref:Putative esterase n=1 Tax=Stackebrandtia nassauensis (strain DSM 44728 / CIP 108903 / NRRL B-16338 / NBRC 102104 / LLR-40K-21) TaxID=446470 RepID=D3PY25_STANL|nr:alpha/beta hydrolase-fold protein [Stackebrandtia nassauensis]ADD45354.1 putative esterase [Stackebrandtia nassauensis DSM 44728]